MQFKFKDSDHRFPKDANFGLHTIFEIYNIDNKIMYLKVQACQDNALFNIRACNIKGEIDWNGYAASDIKREEILNLIYSNDWRIYERFYIGVHCTTLPCLHLMPNPCPLI